jgi:hypothetical protein
MKREKARFFLALAGIFALAAGWKMLLVVMDALPFNADEAVVALMARHILQGARPVFFYGQHYMGSLDAYLIAGAFAVLGEQVWAIRLVQGLLYLGTLGTTVLLGREAFQSWKTGLLAAALLAIPTVNLTVYTTATLGGYGETLLLGNLILWLALRLGRRFDWREMLIWGALVGCGLWVMDMTLIYSGTAAIYLLWSLIRKREAVPVAQSLAAGGLGLLAGGLPWWMYALQYGTAGQIFDVLIKGGSFENTPYLIRTATHLVNFLLLGLPAALGFRPPWEVRWLALPLLPLVLAFWVAVFIFAWKRARKDTAHRPAYFLFWGLILGLAAAFIFSPFGADPSGRYFVAVAAPMALFAAQFILEMPFPRWLRLALPVLLIAFHAWGNLDCALRNPPGITTHFDQQTGVDHHYDTQLMAFLRQEGELRGYSNYWVSFPLAFLSGEELIFEARLPYHLDLRYTPADSRIPAYAAEVETSDRVAYIIGKNPLLEERLVKGLKTLGVDWQEQTIGDYHIFYGLSRVVRPEELDLSEVVE